MSPKAEVEGRKGFTQLKGDIEADYEDGEILLIPEEVSAAESLKKILKANPSGILKLTSDNKGQVAEEGINKSFVRIETQRTRVLTPAE